MKMTFSSKAFATRLLEQLKPPLLQVALISCCALPVAAQSASSVELKWLGDKAPATSMGVSWGVPWPQGKVRRDQAFRADHIRRKGVAASSKDSCVVAGWFDQVVWLYHRRWP
jgi:hypothetical protein